MQVDGGAQPTLDIRAGIASETLGEPPLDLLTGFGDNTLDEFRGDAFVTAEPSGADITVGDVFIAAPNGLVLLTNQYQSNTDLARGSVFVTGEGIYGNGIDARGFGEQGGSVYFDARDNIEVVNSFIVTLGAGKVGDIVLLSAGDVRFERQDKPTGAATYILLGEGTGGTVHIRAATLEVLNGAQLITSAFGNGDAGNLEITAHDRVTFDSTSANSQFISGAFSSVGFGASGDGGSVVITAGTLEVLNGAQLLANSLGNGDAGNVILRISKQVLLDNGTISIIALFASGGGVDIESGHLVLRNDGDILTNVLSGEASGGNININADFAIALEDGDIFTFSLDGRGGSIELNRTTLFSQNLNPVTEGLSQGELFALDGNGQVDINATGSIKSGQIDSLVENSLLTLEDTIVDTAALTAGSCIARTADNQGSFVITGRDGLPQRPGDTSIAAYPTGTVQPVEAGGVSLSRLHSTEETLQEPDGVYQLPDGRLVLSRACD